MISQCKNKQNAIELIKTLERNGYEGYMVGGCVRDMVMGREYNDIDIATSAKPEECKAVFLREGYRVFETGIKHGTVSVVLDNSVYEITTYRIDGSYSDSRHPDSVEFTGDITVDLSRRDFTVNAMAMDKNGEIIDPFGGRADIEKKVIRCVGQPVKRFTEDALRILRAVRFSSVLGFYVDGESAAGMLECAHLMDNVAGERIFAELSKTVLGADFSNTVYSFGNVLGRILPTVPFAAPVVRFERKEICPLLDALPPYAAARFAALICVSSENGEMGKNTVNSFVKRMKCDRNTALSVGYIVSRVFDDVPAGRAVINREVHKWGKENFLAALEIKKLMMKLEIIPFDSSVDQAGGAFNDILNSSGFVSVGSLDINGEYLHKMGVEKGKRMGDVLNRLLDEVAEGKLKNERNDLLNAALKYLGK